jgi:hypothetical protein
MVQWRGRECVFVHTETQQSETRAGKNQSPEKNWREMNGLNNNQQFNRSPPPPPFLFLF